MTETCPGQNVVMLKRKRREKQLKRNKSEINP